MTRVPFKNHHHHHHPG
ncbi:his operon leader peptide [Enterobacter hormaechei subsp. steigerwaltii]|nr:MULTISPECIES: his operon leader peptide [Enterobacter]MCC9336778.1 his operon leader peptide [Enterobacter hormaechei subsp. steigerwaltii]MCC9378558.1 his operon leader peptide [Enterobacter hormaechei subsp. steigerwaltii]MCC9394414.1 his operon leader peptide [Enterobacter hormaechei subsp. steigerwaltii]MCC9416632.1 his operon leader peptide [Enterobacter hormaechei subsp. steigerwaltii]MCD0215952.1 his operon leader peptide [Enterobacter hormaechei subsp. steigerwaltii]